MQDGHTAPLRPAIDPENGGKAFSPKMEEDGGTGHRVVDLAENYGDDKARLNQKARKLDGPFAELKQPVSPLAPEDDAVLEMKKEVFRQGSDESDQKSDQLTGAGQTEASVRDPTKSNILQKFTREFTENLQP